MGLGWVGVGWGGVGLCLTNAPLIRPIGHLLPRGEKGAMGDCGLHSVCHWQINSIVHINEIN
jgi:hypothetical protein